MTTLYYRGYAINIDNGFYSLSINPSVVYLTYEQITSVIDLLIKAQQATNEQTKSSHKS